jgi:hypothetical protein
VNIAVQLPLIRHESQAYAPAAAVTALLRGVGDQWQIWTQQGIANLDAETVDSLRDSLHDLADQLDAECIAVVTNNS